MTFRTAAALAAGICVGAAGHVAIARVQSPVAPDALTAAPSQYHLEFENEYVRVTRIKYAAHAKAPAHSHSAPGGVIVTLTDQDARVTGLDGSTRELHYKAGESWWISGGLSVPVGSGRPEAGQLWQVTCSLQF